MVTPIQLEYKGKEMKMFCGLLFLLSGLVAFIVGLLTFTQGYEYYICMTSGGLGVMWFLFGSLVIGEKV